MRFLTALALALLVAPVAAQDWTSLPAVVASSVLQIEMVDKEGNEGRCSGEVIAEDRIVTNAHCVPEEGGSMTVARKHVRSVLKINRILDLAVLDVEKLKAPAVTFRATAPQVGEPVAVVGYALGLPTLRFQFGWVSSPAGEANILVGPFLDVRIFPGDSGGALFDAKGQLITLTCASFGRRGDANAFAIGIPPEELRDFVEEFVKP